VDNSLWVDGPEEGVCSHPRGRDGDAERRGGIEDPPRGMRSKSGGDSSGCTCWADGITKKKGACGGGWVQDAGEIGARGKGGEK